MKALSLLLAIVLQTMVSNIGLDNNIDEDYDDYPNRSPLLSNYGIFFHLCLFLFIFQTTVASFVFRGFLNLYCPYEKQDTIT